MVSRPPFASMIVTRWNATTGMWEVVPATVSGPSVNDQGATRFYSYTFTYSGASNAAAGQAFGMGHVALVAGQMIRIIGLDGAGNAISTQTFTL